MKYEIVYRYVDRHIHIYILYIYGTFQAKLTKLKPPLFFFPVCYQWPQKNDLHQFSNFFENFSGRNSRNGRFCTNISKALFGVAQPKQKNTIIIIIIIIIIIKLVVYCDRIYQKLGPPRASTTWRSSGNLKNRFSSICISQYIFIHIHRTVSYTQ